MKETETTRVIILTKNLRIEGAISLYSGGRLTDFMNKAEHFIAVVNARVADHDGKELTSGAFLNLNLHKIEVIMPVDSAD